MLDEGTNRIMRIDVGRRQRRRELPQRLLAEGERLGGRGRGRQHLRRVHRRRVLLALAQLAVDDANRHHCTVTSDHRTEWLSNATVTEHTGVDHR